MNWGTVYIKGRADFREEVRRRLKHAALNTIPGYTDSPETCTYDLFWVDDRTDLRTFKKAIGAKLIFKYRLQFFTDLEKFVESQHSASPWSDLELGVDERDMLTMMSK